MRNLEGWQMSASYPQDAVQSDFRNIIKTMARNTERSNKTETTVSIEVENGCLRWLRNIKDELLKFEEDIEVADVDEVDGKVEEMLSPLVKLYFLKILLFDIGISLGDLVTDFLQGINLTFDDNWNIQWTTYHYGLTVFCFIWLPLVPVVLHSATFKKTVSISSSDSVSLLGRFVRNVLFIIFFPLIPTLMYVKLLLIRRRFNTNSQRLLYLKHEQKTSELKAVIGSVESPLQLILLLWLLMRGILRLPWDQAPSSSCLEDSLGRIACLPSIPLLSLSFSFLSIVKSILDLNLVPVLSSPLNSRCKGRIAGHVILSLFPLFLCNLIFRLTSYAFIVTYIDYWAIIPGAFIYLACLSLFGIVFIKHEDEGDDGGEDVPLDDLTTKNDAEEVAGPSKGLQWNGSEWLSTSNYRGTEAGSGGRDDYKVTEQQLDISSSINENNSPIFLNSVAAYFFPVVYTMFMDKAEVKKKVEINVEFMEAFMEWQQKILSYQILLFNSCIIFVLLIIGILVTFVPSFNYRTNILDFFWFSTILVILVSSGLLCLLWSLWMYPRSVFQLRSEKDQNDVGGRKETKRRRHLTGESIEESVSSASQIITDDYEGPPLSPLKLIFCSSMSGLVLLPCVLALLLFKLLPQHPLYLASGQGGQNSLALQAVEVVFMHHIPDIDFVQVRLHLDNSSKRTLKLSHGEDIDLFIDQTREESWRLSSPREILQDGPYILIRNVDWQKIDFNPDQTFLCGSLQKCVEGLRNILACTNQENRIYVEGDGREDGKSRKILNSRGQIYESLSVQTTCFKNGLPCDGKVETNETHLQCTRIAFSERVRFYSANGIEIPNTKIVISDTIEKEYCCGNSTIFMKFYGENCNRNLYDKCNYSVDFMDGKCDFGQLHSSVCIVRNCVIKKSFQTSCTDKSRVSGLCDNDMFSCDLKIQ